MNSTAWFREAGALEADAADLTGHFFARLNTAAANAARDPSTLNIDDATNRSGPDAGYPAAATPAAAGRRTSLRYWAQVLAGTRSDQSSSVSDPPITGGLAIGSRFVADPGLARGDLASGGGVSRRRDVTITKGRPAARRTGRPSAPASRGRGRS
jgi:hypothetical protein